MGKDAEDVGSDLKADGGNANDTQTQSTSSLQARLAKVLPPWIVDNLKDKRTWKTFIRCWISTFAAFCLLLPDKSLQTLGNT